MSVPEVGDDPAGNRVDVETVVAGLAVRVISGSFWHQGPTRFELTSFADPSVSVGRYHRPGGSGVWYASDQEQGAWAELFRHFLDVGVDPFEIRRRVGRVLVEGLRVLDLTDPEVRKALRVSEAELIGDDYMVTQSLAAAARQARFEGILAPSAALPGRRTLVVFAAGQHALRAQLSRVRQPPPRLADLLLVIRPHPDMPAAAVAYLRSLYASGADAIRRRRR